MRFWQRLNKRLFDIAFSAVGLLFLWPVIMICALLAHRDTKMTGIFVQKRVGMDGRLISVRKIRTMKNIPDMKKNTITAKDDARITRLGAVLRRWKLDELPQLWNVLLGEMSFVGPRPDVPGYADRLTGNEQIILTIRPGITGPATIKYKDEELLLSQVENASKFNDRVIYPDKVNLNIIYIRNWTLRNDIRYILITLKILPIPAELTVKPHGSVI